MNQTFTVKKSTEPGREWAWEVRYPDGRLVDIYASKKEAEEVRRTMEEREPKKKASNLHPIFQYILAPMTQEVRS